MYKLFAAFALTIALINAQRLVNIGADVDLIDGSGAPNLISVVGIQFLVILDSVATENAVSLLYAEGDHTSDYTGDGSFSGTTAAIYPVLNPETSNYYITDGTSCVRIITNIAEMGITSASDADNLLYRVAAMGSCDAGVRAEFKPHDGINMFSQWEQMPTEDSNLPPVPAPPVCLKFDVDGPVVIEGCHSDAAAVNDFWTQLFYFELPVVDEAFENLCTRSVRRRLRKLKK